jgi:hypothetical protein
MSGHGVLPFPGQPHLPVKVLSGHFPATAADRRPERGDLHLTVAKEVAIAGLVDETQGFVFGTDMQLGGATVAHIAQAFQFFQMLPALSYSRT